jgi:outer membrane receptor for ferric coprogen and ferric-rhodotorulic acid
LLARSFKSDATRENTGIRSTLSWDFETEKNKHTWLFGFDFDLLKLRTEQYALIRNGTFGNQNTPFVNANGTINNFNWNTTNAFGSSPFILDAIRLSDGTGFSDIDLVGSDAYGTRGFNVSQGIVQNSFASADIPDGEVGQWQMIQDEADELLTYGFWTAFQSEFFNGRLRTLVGTRYDAYDIEVSEIDYTSVASEGEPIHLEADGNEISSTLGALFWITQDIGIFGNFSQSIRVPQAAQKTVFGELPDPEIGQGIECGIRFAFLDNKLNGQVVAFHIEKENDIGETFPSYQIGSIFPQTQYPDLYEPNGNNGFDLLPSVGDRVNGITTVSEGIELDVNYNPAPGFTLALSYAYTDFSRGDVPSNIEEELDTRALLGKPSHRATLTAKYNFRQSLLKGFTVGVNQQWRSESVARDLDAWLDNTVGLRGANGTTKLGEIKTPEEFNTRLFFTYQKKLGKGRDAVKMNLNFTINNLFNEDGLTSRREVIFYRTPRTYNLSANFAF